VWCIYAYGMSAFVVHVFRFSCLSRVILSILLIPVSNCGCERIFSQVRRNKTDFRGSMGPKTLDSLMILKSRKDGPCHKTVFSNELLRKCKSACRKQLASSTTTEMTSEEESEWLCVKSKNKWLSCFLTAFWQSLICGCIICEKKKTFGGIQRLLGVTGILR
jgi:hypothetical protein